MIEIDYSKSPKSEHIQEIKALIWLLKGHILFYPENNSLAFFEYLLSAEYQQIISKKHDFKALLIVELFFNTFCSLPLELWPLRQVNHDISSCWTDGLFLQALSGWQFLLCGNSSLFPGIPPLVCLQLLCQLVPIFYKTLHISFWNFSVLNPVTKSYQKDLCLNLSSPNDSHTMLIRNSF